MSDETHPDDRHDGPAATAVAGAVNRMPQGSRRFAWIGTALGLLLFAGSLAFLWHVVSDLDWAELKRAFVAASAEQLWAAIGFATLSYLLLTCYDALALKQLRLRVPYRTTALASFASYAVSFNLGFPLLTGGTVRYWIYAPKGLRASRVASLTVIAGITFWLGMGLVLTWTLLAEAGAVAALTRVGLALVNLVGIGVGVALVAYMIFVSLKRRAVTIQGWRLELPGFRLSLGQSMIGAAEVCAASAVLYVLLPAGHGIDFELFLAIYVVAVMLGIASHAPGGLGVFEATMLLALSALPREQVLGALLLFRICYYFLPFVVALALLGAYEITRRAKALRSVLEPEEPLA
ncbi:lysylphosphatidylglycerol synthase domain-containing protein [Salinarimonas chemoclinalis]|uniref:lysylphosphatidylglycerol synthase domain-containing protein n=1 Tax=Salinarimonas chemoclinalis TaxID=3241599 RepID=UPI0035580640